MATILGVDDHLPTRELMRALFQSQGHRVLLATNGPEAIALAGKERPDLVFADVVMPAMDGYALVGRLREQAGCKGVPVVLMSASLDEGRARALAAQCGATEYLVKPVEPAHLLATARRILANRENGAAAGHDPRR